MLFRKKFSWNLKCEVQVWDVWVGDCGLTHSWCSDVFGIFSTFEKSLLFFVHHLKDAFRFVASVCFYQVCIGDSAKPYVVWPQNTIQNYLQCKKSCKRFKKSSNIFRPIPPKKMDVNHKLAHVPLPVAPRSWKPYVLGESGGSDDPDWSRNRPKGLLKIMFHPPGSTWIHKWIHKWIQVTTKV